MNKSQLYKKFCGTFSHDEINEVVTRISTNLQEKFFADDKNLVFRFIVVELESKKLAKKYHFDNWSDIERNIYFYYPMFDFISTSYQCFYGRLKKTVKHLDRYCYSQRLSRPYKG